MGKETKRPTGRIKKYGVCLNDKCEDYKQIKEILHGESECPSCHKRLSPCAPPKKKNNKLLIGIIAGVVAVLAIVGAIIAFSGNDEEVIIPNTDSIVGDTADMATDTLSVLKTDTVTLVDTLLRVDTVKVETKVETETTPTATKTTTTTKTTSKSYGSTSGSMTLSYGKYTGATKNGYAHGQGRLTYTTSRVINRNDPKGRKANAGDYVIGEFFNGFVVYGKHYNASCELVDSLTFGVCSESSYDSK